MLLIACMFPWSSPAPTASDTQPIALVLAAVYSILYVRSTSRYLWPMVIMLFGGFATLLYSPNMEGIRGITGYISILFIPLALIHYFKTYGIPSRKFYLCILFIWGAIAIIQFWDPSIIKFLSPRTREFSLTGGRGVTSFAPEPTFYGLWLLIIATAYTVQHNTIKIKLSRPDYAVYTLIAFQLLFLSRSTLVILLVAAVVLAYLLLFRPFLLLAGTGMTTILLSDFFLSAFGTNSEIAIEKFRIFYILSAASSVEFSDILSIDGSVSDRVVQILNSHIQSFNNHLMPNGYGTWRESAENLPEFLAGTYHSIDSLNRVLSLSGSVLYEVGIFSIPFIFFMIYLMTKSLPGMGNRSLLLKIFFTSVFLIQAIPLALPTISFFISAMLCSIAIKKHIITTIPIHKNTNTPPPINN
ncbi:hypothetical protein [Vogesella indigofera]|uniref:hypothetical protein n=1 Tax=Vogesella indigofera TaxID=45465 RepID=UPI00234FA11A|nr:hypothetical protein [Vogesella indigofera]MDC7700864.1 hypothetical protein [Vogesella indigofera]